MRAREGLDPPIGPRRAGTATKLPGLWVRAAPEVVAEWYRLAARQHMRPTAMLRGAVHEYLLDGRDPASLEQRWIVAGRTHPVPSGVGHRAGNLGAIVTRGARDALRAQAQRLGVSQHTLLVGLINDVLAGRRRVRRPVERRTMYAEARRYLA